MQRANLSSLWRIARNMHEWPLVFFTALVMPAAGVFAADLLLGTRITREHGLAVAAALCLAIGICASLAHLGRPIRAPLALSRAGRNALSTEVALALALLVLALGMALSALPSTAVDILAPAAGIVGMGLLVTLGIVYFLPARWPWRSTLVVTPLLAGLAAGMVLLVRFGAGGPAVSSAEGKAAAYYAGFGGPPRAAVLIVVLLVADAVLYADAWLRVRDAVVPLYPPVFARRHTLVAVRLCLVNAMPIAFLVARLPLAATAAILSGVLVDRFIFYGAAARRGPEAEIGRVESLIAGDGATS